MVVSWITGMYFFLSSLITLAPFLVPLHRWLCLWTKSDAICNPAWSHKLSLFVFIANALVTMTTPLLGRIDVLKVRDLCSLKGADVEITPEAVDLPIKWYAQHESGGQNLDDAEKVI